MNSNNNAYKITLLFKESIEVGFEMTGGNIIWWPTFINKIKFNTGDESVLADVEATQDSGYDKYNN